MSKSILLKYCAFLLFASVHGDAPVPDKKLNVSDWNLDVVLMLDQSTSVGDTHYTEAHKDVKTWIESYYDKEDNTDAHFAVVFCCNLPAYGGIRHKFTDGNFKIDVPRLLGSAEYNKACDDNWDGCVNDSTKLLLTGRENATKIAMFITDCDLHMGDTGGPKSHEAAAKNFYEKINKNNKGKLVFLCIAVGDPPYSWPRYTTNQKNINLMLEINHQDHPNDSIIFHHPDFVNFSGAIERIVPIIEVDVFNCKIEKNCSDDCQFKKKPNNASGCYKWCDSIVQLQRPRKLGHPCDPDELMNANETKCNKCVMPTTEKPKAADNTLTIIIVSIAAGLGLILLVAVIVFIFIKRQKKKVVKQHSTAGVRMADKKETVSADLTISMPMQESVRKPAPCAPKESSVKGKSISKASKTKKTATKGASKSVSKPSASVSKESEQL